MKSTDPDYLVWCSQIGRDYQIKDMATSHIINCLRAIQDGKVVRRQRFIIPFKKELARRHSELGECIYGDV